MLPHSLYLAPANVAAVPAPEKIQAILERLEVIGPALGKDIFEAGGGFARHVVFAGCSPYLVMTPPEDGSLAFCHVAVHGPFDLPHLVTGLQAPRPRCPHCRHRFTDWRDLLGAEREMRSLRCPSCHRGVTSCELDWRQHAVCGRVLIELRNVFPGEAVPSDQLMQALCAETAMEWQYGWAQYLSIDQANTT